MKTIISVIALLVSGMTMGQNANAKVTVSKVINLSADKVWEVVKKMDDIHLYTEVVGDVQWKGTHGVGGERVCLPPKGSNGGILNEKILTYSDATRSYTYSVNGVPTKGMVNGFKVVDLGYNKCMIVWTSSYESFVDNPQMNEDQLKGFLKNTLTEILGNMVVSASK